MAHEAITLDPGGSNEIEIDDDSAIGLGMDPDWGTAAVEAALIEGPMIRGAKVGARRLPPRQVVLPLRVTGSTADAFQANHEALSELVAGWQASGGTIRRQITYPDASTSEALDLEVLSADLEQGEPWNAAHQLNQAVTITATCQPHWLAAEESVGTGSTTTGPIATGELTARGDASGPMRVVFADDEGSGGIGRKFVEFGLEHEHYGGSGTSLVVSDANLLFIDSSSVVDTDAFGGTAREVEPLLAAWREIGHATLTLTGSRRVRGRFANTTTDNTVAVRLVWRFDGGRWKNGTVRTVPGGGDYHEIDLDVIDVPADSDALDFILEASTPDGPSPSDEGVRFDFMTLFGTELYGVVRGGTVTRAGGAVQEFDSFDGLGDGDPLNGRTPQVGAGEWSLAGDSDPDWLANTEGGGVRRQSADSPGAGLDSNEQSGQISLISTTDYDEIAVEGAFEINFDGAGAPATAGLCGIVLRYVDASNFLMLVLRRRKKSSSGHHHQVMLRKVIAGSITNLEIFDESGLGPIFRSGSVIAGCLRIEIDDAGNYVVGIGPRATGAAIEIEQTIFEGSDSALAASGTLEEGRVGIYHADTLGWPVTGFAGSGVCYALAIYTLAASSDDAWAIPPGGELEIDVDQATAIDSSDGEAPVLSHQGSDLYLAPGTSRLAFKARRDDSVAEPDRGTDDDSSFTVYHRPAFLFASDGA